MEDKKLLWGWVLAFLGVFVVEGLSKVFIAYSGQVIDSNPIVFTCVTFNISALILLLIGGKGKLSKETMRSLQTWGYGFVMLALYIIAFLLFKEAGAAEGGFLQRASVIFSVFAAWLFFDRKVSLVKVIGLIIVGAGVFLMISGTPKDNLASVLLLVILWGFFHAIRAFIAEMHAPHAKAASLQDPRTRARVIGFVMFVVSLFFTIVSLTLAFINYLSLESMPEIIPSFDDFTNKQTIIMAMLVGVLFTAPLRVIEFTSSHTIKAENFLAVSCFASVATLFWQWITSPITGMTLAEFSTLDMLSGVLVVLGGFILACSSIFVKSKKNIFEQYLKYSAQDLESVEETREIIANSLEHFKSDLSKTAKALGVSINVLEAVLSDKERLLSFNDNTLRNVARSYRKNVAGSDALTGLLNRAGFMTALKAASFESDKLSLFFIDLNKFKPVNDTYGHEAGDFVLQEIAKRLRTLFPKKSLITRLGGDEYCILLLGQDKLYAEAKIEIISKELEKAISYKDNLIQISGSIGLASYPEDTENAEELINLADKKMYTEKKER